MLLLGRDVDSHFVFLFFFFFLTCQEKQCLGLGSAHTCGWCWALARSLLCSSCLHCPAAVELGTPAPGIAGNFEPFADA